MFFERLTGYNQVADSVCGHTSLLIRINDMSLIGGGPFDVYNDWDTPHENHRQGVNADISETCYEDGAPRKIGQQ